MVEKKDVRTEDSVEKMDMANSVLSAVTGHNRDSEGER
jgi:hypothetical protein